MKADRIDYLQDQDIYEAEGSVVVDQGSVHLTADHLIVQALPGIMIATGHVRLTDPKADIVAERLELNVNTEAGVITHGEVYMKASNSTLDGRLIQRFSEDHYRFKEGRFTNCDAPEEKRRPGDFGSRIWISTPEITSRSKADGFAWRTFR